MKIPKLKKWQIVEIEWLDSCSVNGWNKDNGISYQKSDLEHISVGYFLKETEYSIAVVQSIKKKVSEENTSINSIIEIPKVAISKIKLL